MWLISSLLLLSYYFRKLTSIKYLLMFLLGLLYALLACQRQLDQQITTPQTIDVNAYVDSMPRVTPHKISFLSTNHETGRHYLVSAFIDDNNRWPDFKAGELYRFTLRIKPPHGTVNGVGFDRERWLFRHGIDGLATIKQAKLISQQTTQAKHWMHQWRSHMAALIDESFTTPRVNGLIRALSIGDKSQIDSHDRQTFQNTGTAHLIAISGLHIGMVASLGWLLGWCLFFCFPGQRINRQSIQIMTGIALALGYAILAGLAVSTQRALVMLLVYAVFKIRRRPAFAWDVWSTSLVVILLLDPLNVLDSGFWLSFVAVAVLILAFQGSPRTTSKTLNYLKMQWVLLIGMLPLNLSVFASLKLAAPLINFVVIPLITVFVVPTLLLMLTLGTTFNHLPVYLVNYLNHACLIFLWLLDQFNALTATALDFTVLSAAKKTLLILACSVLILPRAIPQRGWALMLLILVLIPNNKSIKPGHFKADFLDVGQGLSVLISTQNHHLIYDVGAAYPSGFNMADAIIMPQLKAQGIKQIDTLILSHRDNDHMGAAAALKKQTSVTNTLSTEPSDQACVAGLSWLWDGVKFEVISPYNITPYLKNNSSCVLKISGADTRLLLTGDIESAVEYRLTQQTTHDIRAEVMLMPHHGSNTSSTVDFIQHVSPKVTINSSGQHNPFDHPKTTVLERYAQQNIAVFDTQSSGKVTLTTDPTLHIEAIRTSQPRIWRKKKPE